MQNPGKPRVIIVGPDALSLREGVALKRAFEALEAHVCLFRTDGFFKFEELVSEMPRRTHLLFVLERDEGWYDKNILFCADQAKIPNVALLCLHTDQSLFRCDERIRQGRVHLAVVRGHAEHARVRQCWSGLNTLIVNLKDLSLSAHDIARAFVGGPSARQRLSAAQ